MTKKSDPKLIVISSEPIQGILALTGMTNYSDSNSGERFEQRQRANEIDKRLLKAIAQDRDKSAMETFYHRYMDRLPPFLQRLTHDPEVIEETYNDVMHKVWRKAHQFSGQSMVSSWVFSIGYRTCLRTLKKHTPRDDLDLDISHATAPENNYEDQQAVNQAMQALSPDHRMVIELTYFQGFSTKEVAQVVGKPVNTVKTRLHHARLKLREALGSMR